MTLSSLLHQDAEAKRLYQALPKAIQFKLRHTAGNVTSLAALREYASDLVAQEAAHYNGLTGVNSGIPLDPALVAEWTAEHES